MTDIRPARPEDWPGLWEIFRLAVEKGDTYPYAMNTDEEEARRLWLDVPQATYAAADGDRVRGTYILKPNQYFETEPAILKPNQPALGAHVCNAGYMVHPDARGRGLGRALCAHSLNEARKLGFTAMQYNLVVVTNAGAIRLWTEMGFETVGVLAKSFRHGEKGLVYALIMYREL